jgi:phosphotransferase system enzyme I (PtsI)
MFPMISGVAELRRAVGVLEECKEELRLEGVEFSEATEVGAMIEIPSAALCADSLARESISSASGQTTSSSTRSRSIG